MHLENADGMVNSVDPDQTAPLEQNNLGVCYLFKPHFLAHWTRISLSIGV